MPGPNLRTTIWVARGLATAFTPDCPRPWPRVWWASSVLSTSGRRGDLARTTHREELNHCCLYIPLGIKMATFGGKVILKFDDCYVVQEGVELIGNCRSR
ncbi:hypothetical protein ACQJBY_003448 [Aegilops geniculata]